jgi:hypothetical protein
MAENQPSVADIFRRAEGMRLENPDWTYKRIADQLVKEYSGGPIPSLSSGRRLECGSAFGEQRNSV